MSKHGLKVALKIDKASVPQLINKGRMYVDAIAGNPSTFINPSPSLATVTTAIDDLENAWNDAANGGKIETAVMHDREDDVRKHLSDLANYVELVANGDESIVHLSGMAVRKKPQFENPDFSVNHTDDKGAVRLRVKPKAKSLYRWEFCEDPMDQNTWQVAKTTDVSITNFGDLQSAKRYWFRVAYVTAKGDVYVYDPISIVVI